MTLTLVDARNAGEGSLEILVRSRGGRGRAVAAKVAPSPRAPAGVFDVRFRPDEDRSAHAVDVTFNGHAVSGINNNPLKRNLRRLKHD